MQPDRRAKDSMRRDYDWSRARLSVESTVVSASSLLPGVWNGRMICLISIRVWRDGLISD